MKIISRSQVRGLDQPMLKPNLRWVNLAVFVGSLLGSLALLRWVPGAPHVRFALVTFGAALLFQLSLSTLLLFNTSAWSKWVNPAAQRSWVRRLLRLDALTSLFFLASLVIVWRFVLPR